MFRNFPKTLRLVLACGLALSVTSVTAQDRPAADPAKVDALIRAMFTRVSPEWQARAQLDETQRACTEPSQPGLGRRGPMPIRRASAPPW